jgi:serine/threonine protein kinase
LTNVRVSDFQGRLFYPDGKICLNGDSAEGVKSLMPWSDANNANQKTDIFALGSAIYFLLKGHLPFPDLDSWKDKLEIVSRFKTKHFPALHDVQGSDVVKKCWTREYESADEVVHDLEKITMI